MEDTCPRENSGIPNRGNSLLTITPDTSEQARVVTLSDSETEGFRINDFLTPRIGDAVIRGIDPRLEASMET